MTGKPRAPHAKDAITTPVLHYTSAVQRNDLYSHDATTNHTLSSHQGMSLWDFQRPRTSEARPRNKKRPNLRIRIPPLDGVPTPIQTDETNGNTIGIALGSPRMIDRRNGIPQLRQQDPFCAGPAAEKTKRTPLQRKPSKWRKIGGLFKAKNAVNPTPNRPFYKVRNNNPPPGFSHSIDSQSHAEAGCELKPEPNSLSPGDDEKDSKPRTKTANKGTSGPKAGDSMPFLEVDIPDTQMERYSVMFGGLLGQGKPALLARRSKTMDGTFSNKESSRSSPEPQRPRRATSPTRSKSPSFTLFPTTQTNKASKVLGTSNMPRGPSPLLRSQTLPTEQEREHLLNGTHCPSLKSPMSPRSRISEFSPTPTPNSSNGHLAQNIEQEQLSMPHGHPPLEINTEIPPSHSPNNKATSTASSSLLSPLSATRTKFISILAPLPPSRKPPTPPTESTLIDNEPEDSTTTTTTNNNNQADDNDNDNTTEPFPKIEISVARSVSVSKGKKKQVVVPVGPGPKGDRDRDHDHERLVPDERVLGKKGKTPMVMDAHFGHRHGNSHDVRIERV